MRVYIDISLFRPLARINRPLTRRCMHMHISNIVFPFLVRVQYAYLRQNVYLLSCAYTHVHVGTYARMCKP